MNGRCKKDPTSVTGLGGETMAETFEMKNTLKESEGFGGDNINNLTDDLLCKILSYLSTKDSVRTFRVSRRWRHLWLYVPVLDLNSSDFRNEWVFDEFFDGFMEFNKERQLERFKWIYSVTEHDHDYFVSRIDEVVKRRVCHLTLLNKVNAEEALVRMPLSLYSCASLVNLTLFCVVFDQPGSEIVSLPCLKTMHLEAVKFDGDSILEALISSCSVLDELIIVTHTDDYLGVVCVRSQSLRCFKLESMRDGCGEPYVEIDGCGDPHVEIDAPKLEFMSIVNYQSESFIIHSINPSAKMNIDLMFNVEYDDPSEIDMVNDFLTALSTVREMTISARTLEEIHNYSEWELVPQFSHLSCLHVSFIDSSWRMFPTFLGCCPNLHTLDLEFDCLPETEESILTFIPHCFVSSLEFVYLKTPITVTETSSKMNLAKYFIKNCVVLKKLMVSESFRDIIKKVKKIPKRCKRCQVVMLKPSCEVVSHGFSLLPMIYEDMFVPKILNE